MLAYELDDLFIMDDEQRRRVPVQGSHLAARRAVMELERAAALVEAHRDGLPLVALQDGTLLLWVLEERRGAASAEFPPLPDRAWPQAGDFAAHAGGPARRWPGLRWERAAATAQRHRFEVWVVSGPEAAEADRMLARKAAAALALSTGDYRDTPCERACLTG
jgi:hypothetical protein